MKKTALVTGASRGIGRAAALALAKEGWCVVLNYFSSEGSAVAAVREILDAGGEAIAVQADVSDPGQVGILFAEAEKRFGPVIGRPHFADLLVELGLAENVRDAFDRYVEKGQRYYVGRTILPIERAIEIIRLSGGVPVLAHPFQYKLDDAGLRELIEHCMAQGLRGMECRYSGYGPEQSAYLEKLAEEYGLVKTGGSDFHGSNKPQISLGSGTENDLHVPCEWLERLKEEAGI